MKTNPKSSMKNHMSPVRSSVENADRAFGIHSVANDVPMTELLRCAPDFEETDYPDRSHMKKKGRLPPAKSTKASRLLEAFITPPSKQEVEAKKAKAEFKIGKFLKVESKVKAMIK